VERNLFHKERKRTKKKEKRGGLWKLPQLWKKQNAALLFSTVAWIKPSEKRARFYPQFPQARRRLTKREEGQEGNGASILAKWSR
jgi:hypothetical protein